MLADSWIEDYGKLLVIVFAMGVPVISLAGYYWLQALRQKANVELKRSMIERGMSVEEIERVVAAGDDDSDEGK